MKKNISLVIAFLLMTVGWTSAFLLGGATTAQQSYWVIPAAVIGAGIGLCLRYFNGRRTALLLAVAAALGLGSLNLFFPDSRVSLGALRTLFSGTSPYGKPLKLRVADRLKSPPFDKPVALASPASLDVSLFARLPAGIDDFCFAPDGTLYASLPSLGALYRQRFDGKDRAQTPELFLHGLDNPSGVLCEKSRLLVAESSRLTAYAYDSSAGTGVYEHLLDDGGQLDHRLLKLDEGILVSVGARCDACDEKNPLRGTLQLLGRNGRLQEYARGLRDVGGLIRVATDNSLWASERSRIYPAPGAADEINRIVAGGDYGWPHCEDDATKTDARCTQTIAASLLLRKRANPAGLMSTAGLDLPVVYRNSLLLVLQGASDVRIVPAIVRLPLTEGRVGTPVPFLGGWDLDKTRPAAIHAGPGGAIFIGDEINGAIYRVTWK